MTKKRALISVSNKQDIVQFARGLVELGWEIVSTGGTAEILQAVGLPVVPVAEVTGFPEILEGRVKTLHPKIYGGILARREEGHLAQLLTHQIPLVDLVVVNLYPFKETVANPQVQLAEAIENIDIGGPSMLRAAAKNYQYVTVVVNPWRYEEILAGLQETGGLSPELRLALATEAFQHTADYDKHIAAYLEKQLFGAPTSSTEENSAFPQEFTLQGEKLQDLRYGENPHQRAAFYRLKHLSGGLGQAEQLHGKELSYNNLVDLQAAWGLVQEFTQPAVAIVKHSNPCGTAERDNLLQAYQSALACDPVSAYGGIVALNRPVDLETAQALGEIFLEVIVAPEFEPSALTHLRGKKNLRLMEVPQPEGAGNLEIKTLEGGFLIQEVDQVDLNPAELKVVTRRQPTEAEWAELKFAWKIVKHVKSNAIVLSKDKQSLGVGAGQMNRVGSVAIALEQAGSAASGAVMASDAFFPFRDSIDVAAQAGITAIIHPGGSIRDEECIQAADEHGLTMVFTGVRHFKH